VVVRPGLGRVRGAIMGLADGAGLIVVAGVPNW